MTSGGSYIHRRRFAHRDLAWDYPVSRSRDQCDCLFIIIIIIIINAYY